MIGQDSLNFLDFLKYGALGASLALAILSYRLLSKEQDKENVRLPMLKSIKAYFVFALALSIFFGITELVGKKFSKTTKAEMELNAIWENQFSTLPDTTMDQKVARIRKAFQNNNEIKDTSAICQNIMNELMACKGRLEQIDQGFYSNIIKLRKAVDQDPDGWINIEFRKNEKDGVYHILGELFISLDEFPPGAKQSNEQIITKWEDFKTRWSAKDCKYVFRSDIPQLVRIFLDKFYPVNSSED